MKRRDINPIGHQPPPTALAVVVMAKRPMPGRVKTRLVGRLSADQAAAVHAAMLRCVLTRVGEHVPGRHVVALDEMAGAEPVDESAIAPAGWDVVAQGSGDLGERLDRVWRAVGGGAAVFFGVDSPDVPADALAGIAPALSGHDVALGPVADGGYWTLAAAGYRPMLLQGIDWGSSSVYHQTVHAAQEAGLSWCALAKWHDVDEPADLDALMQRLQSAAESSRQTQEPALAQLRQALQNIITGMQP